MCAAHGWHVFMVGAGWFADQTTAKSTTAMSREVTTHAFIRKALTHLVPPPVKGTIANCFCWIRLGHHSAAVLPCLAGGRRASSRCPLVICWQFVGYQLYCSVASCQLIVTRATTPVARQIHVGSAKNPCERSDLRGSPNEASPKLKRRARKPAKACRKR